MMADVVDVVVTWVGSKAMRLPDTFCFITVAKFEEDQNDWEKEAWSVVLEFTESPDKQGNPSSGKARFLVETAPEGRLVRGRVFGMYEGREKVAEVEIL
jgi:hypothetical protein